MSATSLILLLAKAVGHSGVPLKGRAGLHFDPAHHRWMSDKTGGQYRLHEDVTGAYSGQTDHRLALHDEHGEIAHLAYSVHQGRVGVQHVGVEERGARRGLATAMMEHLADEHGYANIDPGMTTPDGSGLLQHLDQKFAFDRNAYHRPPDYRALAEAHGGRVISERNGWGDGEIQTEVELPSQEEADKYMAAATALGAEVDDDTTDYDGAIWVQAVFRSPAALAEMEKSTGQQLGLAFGVRPAAAPGPVHAVHVTEHLAHDAHGVHVVHAHSAHRASARAKAPPPASPRNTALVPPTPPSEVAAGMTVALAGVDVPDVPKGDQRSTTASRRGQTYHDLQTSAHEWRPAEIKEFAEVEKGGGDVAVLPVFDIPAGYTPVRTRFSSTTGEDGACELCGAPIKNVHALLNDQKKLSMGVGKVCIGAHADVLMPGMAAYAMQLNNLKVRPEEASPVNELMRAGTPAPQAVGRVRARLTALKKYDADTPRPTPEQEGWWQTRRHKLTSIREAKAYGEYVNAAEYEILREPTWGMIVREKQPGLVAREAATRFEVPTRYTRERRPWTRSPYLTDEILGAIDALSDADAWTPELLTAARPLIGYGDIPQEHVSKMLAPHWARADEDLTTTWTRRRDAAADEAERKALVKYDPDVVHAARLHDEAKTRKTWADTDQDWLEQQFAALPYTFQTRPGVNRISRLPITDRGEKARAVLELLTETARKRPLRATDALAKTTSSRWRTANPHPIGPPPVPNRREYPYAGSLVYQGLPIHVENAVGQTRSGQDKDGVPWSINMLAHYGEVADTTGTDGEPIDIYVGPVPDAPYVYVIHQKVPGTEVHDEDKVIAGVESAREAEDLYRAHYDKPGFFGGLTRWPIAEFRAAIRAHRYHGKRLDTPGWVREKLEKGIQIAHRPGLHLDPVKHRWTRTGQDHDQQPFHRVGAWEVYPGTVPGRVVWRAGSHENLGEKAGAFWAAEERGVALHYLQDWGDRNNPGTGLYAFERKGKTLDLSGDDWRTRLADAVGEHLGQDPEKLAARWRRDDVAVWDALGDTGHGQGKEIANALADSGVSWVRAVDVKPAGAETYRYVGREPLQGRLVARKLTSAEATAEIAAQPEQVREALQPLAKLSLHDALDVLHDEAAYADDADELAGALTARVKRFIEHGDHRRVHHEAAEDAINEHTSEDMGKAAPNQSPPAGYRPITGSEHGGYVSGSGPTAKYWYPQHATRHAIQASLTPDLLKQPYRAKVEAGAHHHTGHCYVASEAYYHMKGGAAAGLKPMSIQHEGGPHWWIRTRDGQDIDLTHGQFATPVPYSKGVGKGFLTKEPSKRAQEVIRRARAHLGTSETLAKGSPGPGWEPVPGGKAGGYRRTTGHGYEYSYPGVGANHTDIQTAHVEEHGKTFHTGTPVHMDYHRNTAGAPKRVHQDHGQTIEPAGRYMLHDNSPGKETNPGWERGHVTFHNPLVIEHHDSSSDPRGWKSRLSTAFGGKKGKALSRAVAEHGHDAIVTVGHYEHAGKTHHHTSEIVDLTGAHADAHGLRRPLHKRLIGPCTALFYMLAKAGEQLALFGPRKVDVKTHLAHGPHGQVHVVHQHQRHAAGAHPAPVAPPMPTIAALAPAPAPVVAEPVSPEHKRPSDARFEGLEVEGYFRAGSPDAVDALGGHAENVNCCRCGARIGHVFMTSHGPMGGDCLATLTGDDSTRRIARQIHQKLAGWAETPSLSGFTVRSSPTTGVSIIGRYAKGSDTWERSLYASDSVAPAFMQSLVEQWTEHDAPRTLDFRVELNSGHELARQGRKVAATEALDARASVYADKALKASRAIELAAHYRKSAQDIATKIDSRFWVKAEGTRASDTGNPSILLVVDRSPGGHDLDWPTLMSELGQAGYRFSRDHRGGMEFAVGRPEIMERRLAAYQGSKQPAVPPPPVDWSTFDPMTLINDGAPSIDPVAVRTSAAQQEIESRAVAHADSIARSMARRDGMAKATPIADRPGLHLDAIKHRWVRAGAADHVVPHIVREVPRDEVERHHADLYRGGKHSGEIAAPPALSYPESHDWVEVEAGDAHTDADWHQQVEDHGDISDHHLERAEGYASRPGSLPPGIAYFGTFGAKRGKRTLSVSDGNHRALAAHLRGEAGRYYMPAEHFERWRSVVNGPAGALAKATGTHIANQPGLHLDAVKHRWVRTEDVHEGLQHPVSEDAHLHVQSVGPREAVVEYVYQGRKVGGTHRMPPESVAHHLNDMARTPPPLHGTGDKAIDAVGAGHATYIGKGNDGIVWDVGHGKVVKVSTTTPFQPANLGHRTPAGAIAHLKAEHDAHEALKGVPLIQTVHGRQVGDHYALVKPKLHVIDTHEKGALSRAELDQISDAIGKVHEKGWTIGDTIQVGRDTHGQLWITDLGQATKNHERQQADRDSLDHLYHAQSERRLPKGDELVEAEQKAFRLLRFGSKIGHGEQREAALKLMMERWKELRGAREHDVGKEADKEGKDGWEKYMTFLDESNDMEDEVKKIRADHNAKQAAETK